MQNITDGTLKMHLGSADAAPGMMQLVDSIRNEMAPDAPAAVLDVMSGKSISPLTPRTI